jgi:hypothetical protein
MEEQRKRVRSGNPAERLAAALLIPAELSRRLRLLSDFQMARLLDNEVCSNLNILAPEMTVCAEAVLRLSRTIPKTRRLRRGRAQAEPQGEHLLHAESVLYHAGIPHLLLPFQRDRFASNVFVVPVMPDAQHALIRAGFRHSNSTPSPLIDHETGRPIRIVEHKVESCAKGEING